MISCCSQYWSGRSTDDTAEKWTRRLSDWIGLIEVHVVLLVRCHCSLILSTSIAALPFRVQRGRQALLELSLGKARAAYVATCRTAQHSRRPITGPGAPGTPLCVVRPNIGSFSPRCCAPSRRPLRDRYVNRASRRAVFGKR